MDLIPIQAEVTAYAPNSAVCQTTNITFNGTSTDERPYGLACDRKISIGTIIYIPAGLDVLDRARAFDRAFIVDDRGGALDTRAKVHPDRIHLDLRVKDVEYARSFGRRIITVYIDAKDAHHATR